MKILAIGDPHGTLPKGLTQIVKKNEPDLIVCTGDVLQFVRQQHDWWKTLSKKQKKQVNTKLARICDKHIALLDSFNLPVILLRGNCGAGHAKSFASYNNLFYKAVGAKKIRGYTVFTLDSIYERQRGKKAVWCLIRKRSLSSHLLMRGSQRERARESLEEWHLANFNMPPVY